MAVNPYRWQHDQPTHLVARVELVGRILIALDARLRTPLPLFGPGV